MSNPKLEEIARAISERNHDFAPYAFPRRHGTCRRISSMPKPPAVLYLGFVELPNGDVEHSYAGSPDAAELILREMLEGRGLKGEIEVFRYRRDDDMLDGVQVTIPAELAEQLRDYVINRVGPEPRPPGNKVE